VAPPPVEEGFGGDIGDGVTNDSEPAPAGPNGVPWAPPALMPGAPDVDSTIG
jgi:hypothetical protein